MIAKNVTAEDLNKALQKVNEQFEHKLDRLIRAKAHIEMEIHQIRVALAEIDKNKIIFHKKYEHDGVIHERIVKKSDLPKLKAE